MQDTYISISKAQHILGVSSERITWSIATGKLSSVRNPKDGSQKLVSLQDVYVLRDLPSLLSPWIIYALVDPRNNAIRYVGRTKEPHRRLLRHLKSVYAENPARYQWIQELKRSDLLPHIEVLEGINGSLQDADACERDWIERLMNNGAKLTNVQYIDQ